MNKILFLSLCLIIVSFKSEQSGNNIEKEFDALFKKEFTTDEPGGSVLVMKGDNTIFLNSYGVEDLSTGKKITENTVFNTGSISKTFVANGILILHEQGLLSLDDNIYTYFDDFENKDIAENVTIKHLLSHTSGLPDLRNVYSNEDYYLTAKDEENFEPLKSAENLNFESGSKFQYSNPAYNGLALIIEKVANQEWQSFIADNIFKPSNMMESKITNGSYPQTGVAHAYVKDPKGRFVENDYGEFPTFAAAGNGGVWSSVLDLAKYEKAIRSNAFLSKGLTEESRSMFRPSNWSEDENPFVGYSWFLGEDWLFENANFNVDLVYHTGSQGGFRAFYITIPEKDILFIGLFNKPIKKFSKLLFQSMILFEKNNWLEE